MPNFVGVQRKLTAHLANCCAAGIEFIPIVAESLGSLAENTLFMVQAIGKAISYHTTSNIPTSSISQLFTVWPSHCGGRMFAFGSTDIPPFPLSSRCHCICS